MPDSVVSDVSSMVDSTVPVDGRRPMATEARMGKVRRAVGFKMSGLGREMGCRVGWTTALNTSGDSVSREISESNKVVNEEVIRVRGIPLRPPSTAKVDKVWNCFKTTVDVVNVGRTLDLEARERNGIEEPGSFVLCTLELALKPDRELAKMLLRWLCSGFNNLREMVVRVGVTPITLVLDATVEELDMATAGVVLTAGVAVSTALTSTWFPGSLTSVK